MKKLSKLLADNNFFKNRLLQNIFIVSFALATVLLIYNVFSLHPSFTSFLIQDKKEDAISIAKHLSSFIPSEKGQLKEDSLPVGLLEQVVKRENDFGLIKLKVYSNSGEVIFSTDPKEIGDVNQEKYFHEFLRNGQVHAVYVEKNTESLEHQRILADVVETYVPLMRRGTFLGALEIYYDITARKEQLNKLLSRSSAILFGSVAGLLFIIILALFKENRTISARERAEKELERESAVDFALSELYEPLISPKASLGGITHIILEKAKSLTGSEHGYVSSIDPASGDNVVHTLTEMLKDQCEVSEENRKIIFSRGEDGLYPSLWGHPLNTLEPFITNSPKTHAASTGLPEGHIPLTRFLSVPVMLGRELVGQIALANKPNDYTKGDLDVTRRLAEFYALAIQRIRAEEALQEAHDELEERVEERTAELLAANENLRKEIEERLSAEEQLRDSKGMLQAVFNGILEPLVLLDKNMETKMVNEAARNYYGVAQDIVGECCHMAIKGEANPCEGCKVPEAILTGKRRSFERKGFMDPERFEHLVVFPLKGRTGETTGVILHIRDITERKLFEKQLIQSEKLTSLGILVSSIAHEINNPNNFITFNVPILRDYLEELIPIVDTYAERQPDLDLFHMPYPEFRKDVFRLLNNIEHGSARINSVVTNLREFSRGKDKREEKWIDLNSVVGRALAMCEVKMTKTVRSFIKDIPGDLPHIYSDPYALEQILINLLLNAAHASDKGDSWIKLSVAVRDSWLDHTILQVSDNGRGMDDKTKQHIFDPFFTSRLRSDGTGLGLYVTHNLVEGLRGRIEMESEPGQGSTFRIILPDKERRRKKRGQGGSLSNPAEEPLRSGQSPYAP